MHSDLVGNGLSPFKVNAETDIIVICGELPENAFAIKICGYAHLTEKGDRKKRIREAVIEKMS